MNLPVSVRDNILGSGLVSRIYNHDRLDSTMEEAKRLIREQPIIAPGTLIIAGMQESGHGRFKRAWFSPEGGIYFSLIIDEVMSPTFTLVAGLAVAESLDDFFGGETQLSWPNDILIKGRKIAGVICEVVDNYTLIGVGINTFQPSQLDSELRSRAISIYLLPQRKSRLLAAIIMRLTGHHLNFVKNGFLGFKHSYERKLNLIGEPIKLTSGKEHYEGVFSGIDNKGAIVLDTLGQRQTLSSAEITAHEFKIKEGSS